MYQKKNKIRNPNLIHALQHSWKDYLHLPRYGSNLSVINGWMDKDNVLYIQWVPYTRTSKLQTLKDAYVRSINVRHEGNSSLPAAAYRWCSFSSSLPPPLFPPVSNSSCLFTQQQPLYATYCTVLLNFSGYCKIKIFCFFNVLLCEKYYKPITVQVNCVSGVLGLSLLDLQTKWTYECTLRAHSNVRDILHIYIYIYIHIYICIYIHIYIYTIFL